ncbi:hypothetical protein ACO0R3_002853 [Hanseniaspora guilliermondii]
MSVKLENDSMMSNLSLQDNLEDFVKVNISSFQRRFNDLKGTDFYKSKFSKYKNIDWNNYQDNESQYFLDIMNNAILSPMEYNFIFQELTLPIVSFWINKQKHSLDSFVERLSAIAMIIPFNKDISSLTEHFVSQNMDFINANLLNDYNQCEVLLLALYRLIQFDRLKFLKFCKAEVLSQIMNGDQYSAISKLISLKIYANLVEMAEAKEKEHINIIRNSNSNENQLFIGLCDNTCEYNYEFLDFNEANRIAWVFSLTQKQLSSTSNDYFTVFPKNLLTENVQMVYGKFVIYLEHKITSTFSSVNHQNLIANASYLESEIQTIIDNLNCNTPTMITGSAGVGKTHIIQSLHKRMCNDPKSIISIHLGEQTDAKLLLGTYTSGSKPGTFEWKNGVLTTAIKEGKWVVVEDINKAPTEVLSVLLSLLENRSITIPSRDETIHCANGFNLISTITTSENNETYKDLIGYRLWKEVKIPEIPDLLELLKWKSDESLHSLLPKLIAVYEEVKAIVSLPSFTSLNKGATSRPVTVRDLVKLCDRLSILVEESTIDLKWMTSDSYDMIFLETVSCFTSFVSEPQAINLLAEKIGEILQIQRQRITSLVSSNYIPALDISKDKITVGRCSLNKNVINKQKKSINDTSFATTNHAKRLMEKVCVSIRNNEPLLLVGETGTGKTTVVQQVSKMLHKKLTVINVSQQTETSDLLGGYKPVNCRTLIIPIVEDFEELFPITFSMSKNEKFYSLFHKCVKKQHWPNVIKVLNQAYKMAESLCLESINETTVSDDDNTVVKKRKMNSVQAQTLLNQWQQFKKSYEIFEVQAQSLDKSFVFDFVEGSLVKAIKNGEWLLLDELNLATADTLENIADLLNDDPENRSILLSEKGEAEAIKVHPDFRLFGCMNPATDVGKRDLPLSIRSRFTEIYVESPDSNLEDLLAIIDKYIGKYSISDEWVGNDIASLYMDAKKLSEANKIIDGSGQRPHFSIRTLTRTLLYVIDIVSIYGLRRSLYEGFCMSYLTHLDLKSELILKPYIEKYTIDKLKNSAAVVNTIPKAPDSTKGDKYIQFKHYWLKGGTFEQRDVSHYIITPFVEKNMLNLVRASSSGRFPVLVQGPTSSGKTSMIKYLADLTGHKMVRINNHEHTDLQEYLGTYVTDDTGKLTFKEGILVEALKNGYWIVLDELNLAPTDVLEALNRLLDDNRELLIPETQEIVHPHPDFMLFATQNPPGLYGGRKVLSRAFRNRFLELHFDDIPQDELEIIIKERCQIAPSYAKKIVDVYRELTVQRSANRVFETKNSFATLRDLFRWANREAVGYEQLAANGYMLLAERCRTSEEKAVVKKAIEKVMRVSLDMQNVYDSLINLDLVTMPSQVVWTKTAKRLSVLVSECLKNNEPVLLVGETGCGKTTIVQLIAQFMKTELIGMNAHQNTETGDILGAQRPLRNRSSINDELHSVLSSVLNDPSSELSSLIDKFESSSDYSNIDDDTLSKIKSLLKQSKCLFEWTDGPLIQALKNGNFFLLDEISLADDSVLERLNSVLEPERSLLLAEKGTGDMQITAASGFQFFATMNPGGDYGKKELSPALRNRFTEIWVPSMEDFKDVSMIVKEKLSGDNETVVNAIVKFSEWFALRYGNGNAKSGVISLRDILAWAEFYNASINSLKDEVTSLVHGAAMVFIDALGTNNTAFLAANLERLKEEKKTCYEYIFKLMGSDYNEDLIFESSIEKTDASLKCGFFKIPVDSNNAKNDTFNMSASTTSMNLMRVIRAMQVNKPILLEGSPGVGKTSLIQALADSTGKTLTRINLSEQTDLIDLFGSDTPGENTGEFVWRDAPFLRAMQKGEWVLLDEMNLASQSVLEGLNACLDHRGEAYIPELDKSFSKSEGFMVFAAQNPQFQGGGRKGLPKSFVNRFSVVYADSLTSDDLNKIAQHLYPNIDPEVIEKMILLMSTLDKDICVDKKFGSLGSPWEFNLRDTLRWLSLLDKGSIVGDLKVQDFLNVIVRQRFRSDKDKEIVDELICSVFGSDFIRDNFFSVNENFIEANGEILSRMKQNQYRFGISKIIPLQCNFEVYESFLRCIKHNWPMILTGPSNSGKTKLIKLMSGLLGAKVLEFSMNSDVDSMDILGGYEQVDVTRKLSYVLTNMHDILIKELASSPEKIELSRLLDFVCSNVVDNSSKFEELISLFNSALSNFSLTKESVLLDVKCEIVKFSELWKKDINSSVKFEWFDGMLVKAVEEGHWLILDNANLCSPSVLDRLNSLLETNGSLVINECSLEDGRPRVVKPHPNFRLFLTCNPKYGELSRAMRNRGIEIFMPLLSERATNLDNDVLLAQKPAMISNHVSLSNTSDYNYAKLQDIMSQKVTDSKFCFNVIRNDQLSTFNNWKDDISKLPYTSIAGDNGIFTVCENAGMLNNELFISSNTDSSVVSLQYLNEFINSYINSNDTNANFAVFIKIFCIFVDISTKLKAVTDSVTKHDSSKNSSINHELSFLEKSAATFFNLSENARIDKSYPVFQILHSLHKFVSILISKVSSKSMIMENVNNFLIKIMLLCISMISSSDSGKKNEAKLRIYHEMLSKWLNSVDFEFMDSNVLNAIRADFDSTVVMSRGFEVNNIWNHFRADYPTSEEGWKDYEKLMSMSDSLDNLSKEQFEESYEFIDSLKSLIKMLTQDLNSGVSLDNVMFDKINGGLAQLNEISSKFLVKRTHFFQKEFSEIFKLVLFSVQNNSDVLGVESKISKFAINALLPTKLQNMIVNDYSFLKHLWIFNNDSGSLDNLSIDVIQSSVLLDVLNQGKNMTQSQGFEIDQTLNDCKLLLRTLIENSEDILVDSKTILLNKLITWCNSILNVVNQQDANTSDVISKYFNEITSIKADDVSDIEWSHIGRLYLSFGLGSMKLFCPDKSYDPAIRAYCDGEQYDMLKALYLEISEEWKLIRKLYFNDSHMLKIEDSLPSLDKLSKPSKPMVFRNQETDHSDSLFDEWNSFIESTLSEDSINSLISSFETNDKNLMRKIEIFQNNTSQFIKRMNTSYTSFADLNDIFVNYIYSIKLGIDILLFDYSENRKTYAITPSWCNQLSNIFIQSDFISNVNIFNEFLKTKTVDDYNVEKMVTVLLKIIQFQSLQSDDAKLISNKLLETLYYRWSLRRMKQEQIDEQNEGLYKYDYDVEKLAEEEFMKMFPDYEDSLTVDTKNHNKDDKLKLSLDDVSYEIAKVFVASYGEGQGKFDVSDLLHDSTFISQYLSANPDFAHEKVSTDAMISSLFNLNREICQFKPNEASDKKGEQLNFYNDYSIFESKRAIDVISRLSMNVNNLLLEWPENATLAEILRTSKEFLTFPIETPIARLILKVEQIFTFVAEWEKYASSGVSLKSHYDSITSLIVSWRQKELHTWSCMLDSEDIQLEKNLGKWWFYLFESIVVAQLNKDPDEDNFDEINGLLSSLNVFFTKSKIGEFNSRLSIVKAFLQYCLTISNKLPKYVINSLSNIIKYYEQFTYVIEDNIKTSRKKIEKQVKDIILLASWKDVNVDALKQSSKKSHNSLFKLIRKYREVINRDCQFIIEQGLQDVSNVKAVAFESTKKINFKKVTNIDVITEELMKNSDFSTRTSMLTNVEQISVKMNKYIDDLAKTELPNILTLAEDTVSQADYLLKETPSVFTKEKKKEINALKNTKLLLLSDTIKEFKRIGYKVNMRDDIHSYLSTITNILAKMQPFDDTEFASCDKYIFKLLDLFPKVRSIITSNEMQQDIPVSDMTKCLSILENLLYDSIKNRKSLYEFGIFYDKFDRFRIDLEKFGADTVDDQKFVIKSRSKKAEFENIISTIVSLKDFITVLINVTKISAVSFDVRKETAVLTNYANSLESFNIEKCDIITNEQLKIIDEYHRLQSELLSYLDGYNGNIKFIMTSLKEFIRYTMFKQVMIYHSSASKEQLSGLEKSFRNLYEAIVISVQKLTKQLQPDTLPTFEDDKWSKKNKSLVKSILMTLQSKSLVASYEEINTFLKTVDISDEDGMFVKYLIKFTQPLINNHYSLQTNLLSTLKANYYEQTKATYILSKMLNNLATKGLCQPEIPVEEQGEEESKGDAEGLGDGEADGVNNDGLNQEDLEDMDMNEATNENNEENNETGAEDKLDVENINDKDNKEEKNNEEMDDDDGDQDNLGDVAGGDMDNVEQKSDDSDSDNSDSDEEDESDLDEGVDHDNGDNEDAIDEKMWDQDEPVEEEDNEKDGDVNNEVDADNQNDNGEEAKELNGEQENIDEDNEEESKNKESSKKDRDLGANSEDEDLENNENDSADGERQDADEEGEESESEEEVGVQEDEVTNKEDDKKDEFQGPEVDTMDLPENINFESDDEEKQEKEDDEFEDNEDINMDDKDEDYNDDAEDVEDAEGDADENVEEVEEENNDVDMDDEEANSDDAGGENQTDSEVEEDQEDIHQHETEEKAGGEEADEDDNNLDGLENANTNTNEVNKEQEQETKQSEGNEGEGADNQASSEKQDTGASGATQEQVADNENSNEDNDLDHNREKAKETIKQLGDALKEYHNRRKEINEKNEEDLPETEDVDVDNADEFEYVDGETGGDNLQALGEADKEEQVKPYDEDLEIDDDEENVDAMDVEDNEENFGEAEGNNADVKVDEEDISENKTDNQIHKKMDDDVIETYLAENIDYLDDLDQLIQRSDNTPKEEHPLRSLEESRRIWQKAEQSTAQLSSMLSEQLRLILEPTLATKLRGDYKTGKRLNMKKIIPYIASQFRKDKIWLRRTKPSKREYQIMISVDNSKSMKLNPKTVDLTFDSIALVYKALQQLEAGNLSILKFGEYTKEILNFENSGSQVLGEEIVKEFNFLDNSTNVLNLVCESMKILLNAQNNKTEETWQLHIIISDGILEDHELIQRLVRRCYEKKIMLVFLVLDIDNKESILDMQQVKYNSHNKLQITKYLDTFPFEFYLIINDINKLPAMLSEILRQYFQQQQ